MLSHDRRKQILTRWLSRLVVAMLAASLALGVMPIRSVHAATFTVTNTSDRVDINIGDGICDADPAAGLQCTLRAAIQEANATPAADSITLPVATFTLSLGGANENNAATGDLDLKANLTINGAGAAATVINGNNLDRVFDLVGGFTVTLSNLTVTGGNSGVNNGGGIIISNNGRLTLTNSAIRNNTTNANAQGGGIALSTSGSNQLTLNNSTVISNTTTANGGGIFIGGGSGLLNNSSVVGNIDGILNQGTLTLNNSSVRGIIGNANNGNGLTNTSTGRLTLNNSTVSGNATGVANSGVLTMTNSTLSGNNRGGLVSNSGSANLNNVTIANNNNSSNGGGIRQISGTVNFKNSLLAGNTSAGSPSDCSGTLTSQDNNLIQSVSGCTITGASAGNLTGVNPGLSPLQNNGGPTFTQGLPAGSPAIDAGGNSGCAAPDQRGKPRPKDGNNDGSALCDIGAYEFQPLVVNNTSDTVDASPGNSLCATAANACTLRAAIQEANAIPLADLILLPAGTYNLTLVDADENNAARGDLDITASLTLLGAGAATTIIKGNNLDRALTNFDRVFEIRNTLTTVTLAGVTIRDGNATDAFGGGGILNSGTLILNNSTVTSNTVSVSVNAKGGGIGNTGVLTVNNSLVSGNSAIGGGGGLLNSGSGAVTLNNSTVSGNAVGSFSSGGGILNSDSASTLTLNNSVVSGNQADSKGGGIVNNGTLTLNDSVISGNQGGGVGIGGGIFSIGTLTLANSTVKANGGDGIFSSGSLSASKSSVSGNSRSGIANGGALTLSNSTVSGNVNGLFNSSGSANLNNVTIANNTTAGNGGGILSINGTVTLKNTLLAGNSASTGPDCSGTLTSQGNNLIQNTSGCAIVGATTGNLTGVNPQLGPLQNNGGSTFTHALLVASLAIDAGDNASCPASDQRGRTRPADGNNDGSAICDIGAYEFVPIVVKATADELTPDGKCSLREAVRAANTDTAVDSCVAGLGSDTILLPAGIYTLTISGANEDVALTGDLDIRGSDLTVSGAGASTTIINGNGSATGDRVFDIFGVNATLSKMTIRGGTVSASSGGGVNNGGNLTIANSVVTGNTANSGGGLSSSGNLTLTNSALRGNSASGVGGGLFTFSGLITILTSTVSDNSAPNGGGLQIQEGTVNLRNSTVSTNTAGSEGGGLFNLGVLTLVNSTISGNSAAQGGGLVNGSSVNLNNASIVSNTASSSGGGLSGFGTINLKNSLIAGNTAPSGPDCSATLTSQDYNLIGNPANCVINGTTTNNKSGNPKIGPLRNNGGATLTHTPLTGSPALDAGNPAGCVDVNNSLLTFDQRGFPRSVDGDGNGSAFCDIGALEKAVGISQLFVPNAGMGSVDLPVTFTLTWTHPIRWRDLQDLDLRLRDAAEIVLWVRFTEGLPDSVFSLLNADGSVADTGLPGENRLLENNSARLYLDQSSFVGAGPDDPDVTVNFGVSLKAPAAGRTYTIELVASEDSGDLQGPDIGGSWTVISNNNPLYMPLILR